MPPPAAPSQKLYTEATQFIQPGAFFLVPTAYFAALAGASISHAELRVLCALARFRNSKTGKCHPSREGLERATGMPETSISRATTSLQRKGWLVKHLSADRRKVEQYDLLLPIDRRSPAKKAEAGASANRASSDTGQPLRTVAQSAPRQAQVHSVRRMADMPDMGDLMGD